MGLLLIFLWQLVILLVGDFMNIDKIVERFKKDTNNCGDFTYRIMYVNNKKLYIIYIQHSSVVLCRGNYWISD